MTYEEIGQYIDEKLDKAYSGFFSPSQQNNIGRDAELRIGEKKYQQFQVDRKIPDDLGDLVTKNPDNESVSGTTFSKPDDYWHLFHTYLGYTVNGTTHKRIAYTPTLDMLKVDDPFEQPTIIYPQIIVRDQFYFYPDDVDVDTIDFWYMKYPQPFNVLDNTTEPEYNERMQRLVIDEAVNIAAQILRDQGLYQMTEREIQDNP